MNKREKIAWRKGYVVRSFLKIAVVVACAYVLCGFTPQIFPGELYQYRGKPVGALIARVGEPIQKQVVDGNKLYYWRISYIFGERRTCKVWTILDKQDVITNWGYENCAY